MTPETVAQRARLVGMEHALDRHAGSALGRLLLAGTITQSHYDAGSRLFGLWRDWRLLAGIPARRPAISGLEPVVCAGLIPEMEADPDPARWRAARDRYLAAERAVGSRFAWAAIDSLVIDDVMPPRLAEDGPLAERALEALVAGLDALARHFGIIRPAGKTSERLSKREVAAK